MKTIDQTTLFVASPGAQTADLVSILFAVINQISKLSQTDQQSYTVRKFITDYFFNPAQPIINTVTGTISKTSNTLNFPDQVALTRSEIPAATIVCIMPAEDDASTIAKMTYHTYWKVEIQTNPESAIALWPELAGKISDPVLCEAAFMSDVFSKCSPSNWIKIDTSAADLVIDFKTVMGLDSKDLNQIISDFLQMPRQSQLDTFIEQFRAANQQYLG
jgi:hypothetical protein